MDRLLPLAEQLDRAAVELRLDHPLHNRLALILVDNAVEIMARHSLAVHAGFGGDYKDGINSAKQRQLARSQRLQDRLSMLVLVKELTQDEADFVLAAHEHRNAAYHEGFGGRPYLRPLCISYYHFACVYLTRFRMGWLTGYVSNFQFTEISRRYYDASLKGDGVMSGIDRFKLAGLLEQELPASDTAPIQTVLADELESDRQGIAESFRFLIENIRPRQSTAFILQKVQFDHARDTALYKKGLESTHFDTPRRIEAVQFVKTTRAKYLPRYKAIPHGAWSKGIARIRINPDPQAAVVQFQRLRASMSVLLDAICDAAMKLDMEIQSQYD